MMKLKELRGNRTQEYIAKQLGIPRGTYRNYEAGTRKPDPETLIKIAKYYGVSIDYLLGRDNPEVLYIPENMRNIPLAFHNGIEDLTQEDIDDVSKYIEFIKNRKKNRT